MIYPAKSQLFNHRTNVLSAKINKKEMNGRPPLYRMPNSIKWFLANTKVLFMLCGGFRSKVLVKFEELKDIKDMSSWTVVVLGERGLVASMLANKNVILKYVQRCWVPSVMLKSQKSFVRRLDQFRKSPIGNYIWKCIIEMTLHSPHGGVSPQPTNFSCIKTCQ